MGVRARSGCYVARYVAQHFSVMSKVISAVMTTYSTAILAKYVKVGNLHHFEQNTTNRAFWHSNLRGDVDTSNSWESWIGNNAYRAGRGAGGTGLRGRCGRTGTYSSRERRGN